VNSSDDMVLVAEVGVFDVIIDTLPYAKSKKLSL